MRREGEPSQLDSWSLTVKRTMDREAKEFQERLDYWNSRKGRRVRSIAYGLRGTITDVMVVPVSSQPRIIVKWSTGSETSELPANIVLLRRKKK